MLGMAGGAKRVARPSRLLRVCHSVAELAFSARLPCAWPSSTGSARFTSGLMLNHYDFQCAIILLRLNIAQFAFILNFARLLPATRPHFWGSHLRAHL